jgi:flagella basal body P-ring formation protein FlgA
LKIGFYSNLCFAPAPLISMLENSIGHHENLINSQRNRVFGRRCRRAGQPAFQRQDTAVLREAAEQFLRTQTAGLPGNVEITVNQFDPHLNLAACAAPQAFLPNGARAWGRTSVGVRCTVTGDLTTLPAGVVTDPAQAIGRTVAGSLAAGAPLRIDQLRTQMVVQQGQTVRLVTSGQGFRVSSEGRALTNGSDGQVIQARTQGGQMVSGIARMGGVVEVAY